MKKIWVFFILGFALSVLTACQDHECISSNYEISWDGSNRVTYNLSCLYPVVGDVFSITFEKEGNADIGVILTFDKETVEIKGFPYTYTKTFSSAGDYSLSIVAGYYYDSDILTIERTTEHKKTIHVTSK